MEKFRGRKRVQNNAGRSVRVRCGREKARGVVWYGVSGGDGGMMVTPQNPGGFGFRPVLHGDCPDVSRRLSALRVSRLAAQERTGTLPQAAGWSEIPLWGIGEMGTLGAPHMCGAGVVRDETCSWSEESIWRETVLI